MFAGELNDEEMNRLAWIASPEQTAAISQDAWQDYVNTILSFAEQRSTQEIRDMSLDEWAKGFKNK